MHLAGERDGGERAAPSASQRASPSRPRSKPSSESGSRNEIEPEQVAGATARRGTARARTRARPRAPRRAASPSERSHAAASRRRRATYESRMKTFHATTGPKSRSSGQYGSPNGQPWRFSAGELSGWNEYGSRQARPPRSSWWPTSHRCQPAAGGRRGRPRRSSASARARRVVCACFERRPGRERAGREVEDGWLALQSLCGREERVQVGHLARLVSPCAADRTALVDQERRSLGHVAHAAVRRGAMPKPRDRLGVPVGEEREVEVERLLPGDVRPRRVARDPEPPDARLPRTPCLLSRRSSISVRSGGRPVEEVEDEQDRPRLDERRERHRLARRRRRRSPRGSCRPAGARERTLVKPRTLRHGDCSSA